MASNRNEVGVLDGGFPIASGIGVWFATAHPFR